MRLRRLDVEIASKCVGATFSLTGDDGAELFEGVEYFNYFWRVLHQTEEEWTAVLWIIGREKQVLGRSGKLLRREGADLIFVESFY